jgi:hypothetical protein
MIYTEDVFPLHLALKKVVDSVQAFQTHCLVHNSSWCLSLEAFVGLCQQLFVLSLQQSYHTKAFFVVAPAPSI